MDSGPVYRCSSRQDWSKERLEDGWGSLKWGLTGGSTDKVDLCTLPVGGGGAGQSLGPGITSPI